MDELPIYSSRIADTEDARMQEYARRVRVAVNAPVATRMFTLFNIHC